MSPLPLQTSLSSLSANLARETSSVRLEIPTLCVEKEGVTVQTQVPSVVRRTQDVMQTPFNAGMDSVSLGTLCVTKTTTAMMGLTRKSVDHLLCLHPLTHLLSHLLSLPVREKPFPVTMEHACLERVSAMEDGNVLMEVMKLDVTKELLVTQRALDARVDSVCLSIPFVMQSLTVLMEVTKMRESVKTVKSVQREPSNVQTTNADQLLSSVVELMDVEIIVMRTDVTSVTATNP